MLVKTGPPHRNIRISHGHWTMRKLAELTSRCASFPAAHLTSNTQIFVKVNSKKSSMPIPLMQGGIAALSGLTNLRALRLYEVERLENATFVTASSQLTRSHRLLSRRAFPYIKPAIHSFVVCILGNAAFVTAAFHLTVPMGPPFRTSSPTFFHSFCASWVIWIRAQTKSVHLQCAANS